MPTSAFFKFRDFVEQLGLGRHNLSAHVIKVALIRSDADAGAGAAPQVTDTILADMVQPTGTGYTAGGEDTQNTWTEALGIATLTGTKVIWTAGAGDWESFRYVVAYNDSTVTPDDQVIGGWDYASDLTLGDGETFTVKFNGGDPDGTIFTLE